MPRTLDAFETQLDEYLKELCRRESTHNLVNTTPRPTHHGLLGRFRAWFLEGTTYESHLDILLRRYPYLLSDLRL
jgi:hypothetical protein